ncbi:16609_t:CDS:2 [Racocetra fulgida]|uniref:16609_t:CDS:1 n=1 Tax=Racocetra fulgida TaxID=60492 RepID=A0A9N9G0T2_9GLOM|nr:16609_t:CDS:2 [Racocetra fulgida]
MNYDSSNDFQALCNEIMNDPSRNTEFTNEMYNENIDIQTFYEEIMHGEPTLSLLQVPKNTGFTNEMYNENIDIQTFYEEIMDGLPRPNSSLRIHHVHPVP